MNANIPLSLKLVVLIAIILGVVLFRKFIFLKLSAKAQKIVRICAIPVLIATFAYTVYILFF